MMRSPASIGAVMLLLAADYVADAAAVELHPFPRAVQGKGFLSVPVGTVERKHHKKVSDRADDGNAFLTTLKNLDFFYATDISIGTPPQTVTVLVDTGSSELWVNPDCQTAPTSDQAQQCVSFGQYNPDDSTTPPTGPFGREVINYGDPSDVSTQSSVVIRYFTDTLSLGDAKITNQTFGVVASSEGQSQGIMGLAPDLRGGFDGTEPYSLLLNTMAAQGVIDSRVFSLDLRHANVKEGAIIYGGLDRNKFIGSLERRPIVRGSRGEFRLAVDLDTLGVTMSGRSSSFQLKGDDTNVMLDSGTTISRMHYAAAQPILQALDATDDGEGYYYTSCATQRSTSTIDFGFGNKTVRVPLADFILNVGDPNYCYIGLVVTTDQQILGDSVLRAGYFVFDWDNEAVHVAQAADCGDSDIVAVGSGTDAVPSATGNCKEVANANPTTSPDPTTTATDSSASFPTGVYTTVFTITSCPPFDLACETGRTTTQTMGPVGSTPTTGSTGGGNGGSNSGGGGSSGNGNGDGNGNGNGDQNTDGDSAAGRTAALSWLVVLSGSLAAAYNTL